MTLAEKIVYFREKDRLSQGELAERLNVTRQAISKWENGQATPEIENLVRMSRLFGVTVDALLTDGADCPRGGSPRETGAPCRTGGGAFLSFRLSEKRRLARGRPVLMYSRARLALDLCGHFGHDRCNGGSRRRRYRTLPLCPDDRRRGCRLFTLRRTVPSLLLL